MHLTINRRTLALVASAAAGIAVATVLTTSGSDKAVGDAGASKPEFQRNDSGQTYGSLADVPPGEEPDLIEAYGDGGATRGYVKWTDLETGPEPTTPEEAIARQRKLEAQGDRTVPLYASDGKTVVGSHVVHAPGAGVVQKTLAPGEKAPGE